MKILGRINVGMRILAGFALVLIVSLAPSTIGFLQFGTMDNAIQRMATINGSDSQIADQLSAEAFNLQIAISRYVLTNSDADLKTYNDEAAATAKLLAQAKETIKDPQRAKLIETYQTDFTELDTNFKAVVKIVQDRQLVVNNVLMVKGPEAETKIDEIISILDKARQASLRTAATDKATPAAADASTSTKSTTTTTTSPNTGTSASPAPVSSTTLTNALLQANWAKIALEKLRLAAFQFIYQSDQSQMKQIESSYSQFMLNIGQIRTAYPDEELSAKMMVEQGVALEFYSGFQTINDSYSRQNTLMTQKVNVLGPKLVADISAVRENIASSFTGEKEAASRTVANERTRSYATAVIAMLIGVIVAFFIVRSLTVPLKKITQAAERMAEGDLSQNLDISQRDEIGKVANAFGKMLDYQVEMAEVANRIAAGDLTIQVTPKSEKDQLGHSFVGMVDGLRQLVSEVTASASELKTAIGVLSNGTDDSSKSTTMIAETIQQVSQGIANQAGTVNQTAMAVEQMTRAIDGIARGAGEQADAVGIASNQTASLMTSIQAILEAARAGSQEVNNAASTARDGSQTVEHTVKGMESIREKVSQSARKVEEMGRRSQQIGSIVETIDDIASQTNLLALNAAIEAARAGEHGKGFAVVADEVRKLAEKSGSATREISSLVKGIQTTVQEAVSAMAEGAAEVESGVQQAHLSGQALQNILDAVEAVNRQVNAIAQASDKMSRSSSQLQEAMEHVSAVVEENTAATVQMATGANEVSSSIENIAAISQENNAAAEEVAASTVEMSHQIEEMAASANSLSDMADGLQELVGRFHLGDLIQAEEPGEDEDQAPDPEQELEFSYN